ncbi:uncharacterized protein LOC115987964 isoform X2 [Quercus lobata]|uniref:uncharacterized protein LOC115987964 isoform X2 n=1 Tax=Quercus lobata TaxID=97700 RepID=UPI0012448E36|nr:uncharacterized protein LOC115987964 isoform X2 [Quercus lobata]
MASYGTMQRPGTSSTSPPLTQTDDSKDSARKKRNDFKLLCPFNIPISPEAAAVRIIRNLRIIDKRLVLTLLAIGTAVELILTRAAIHLLVSLACGIPIVLVHAVLRVSDDLFVGEEACAAGELVPLVHGKTGDVDIESPASV